MQNKFKNKKILVTGGAGFIGSHMVDKLIALEADVFVIDDLSAGKKKHINPRARFYECDIVDNSVSSILEKEKPNIIYHFAANTNVPKGVQYPRLDSKAITGSVNIIDISRKLGTVEKLIFSSTGFLYGNVRQLPIDETYPLQPISPYAVSKIAIENFLEYFSDELPRVIFRYSTVYGPRQIMTGAMQAYIRELSDGKQSEMYGDPANKTRDYVFVDDIIHANLLALNVSNDHPLPVFNVGSGKETSLIDIYNLIGRLLEKKPNPIIKPERSGDLVRYSLNSEKIRTELGWKPQVTLEEGMKRTLTYWRDQLDIDVPPRNLQ